jgi:hypothetical protein
MVKVPVRPPVGLVHRLRDCRPLAMSAMRLLPPLGAVGLSLLYDMRRRPALLTDASPAPVTLGGVSTYIVVRDFIFGCSEYGI